jgi:hypothetical protein
VLSGWKSEVDKETSDSNITHIKKKLTIYVNYKKKIVVIFVGKYENGYALKISCSNLLP